MLGLRLREGVRLERDGAIAEARELAPPAFSTSPGRAPR